MNDSWHVSWLIWATRTAQLLSDRELDSRLRACGFKVSKGAKIRNRFNQVAHLTQDDTDGNVTNSQLDPTNESQEVSPF